ncbi:MAG TPA: HAD family hydrolase [Actinomycetota bacterium]|nr:HAD family hydrolase [Actinomycetota bacterium]
MTEAGEALLIDVDGTLVDTNYHHALAWYRAFRRHDVTLPLWRIHRTMGMGGDQLVKALAGEEVENELGDAIRAAEKPLYGELIGEVQPLEGAHDLLADLHSAGRCVVLASSAKREETEHYLDLLDARKVVDAWTDSSDVKATKPEPDLIYTALEKVGASTGTVVGDSVYDCIAAGRAGLPSLAVLMGGFSREELREAGASDVFETLSELRSRLLP